MHFTHEARTTSNLAATSSAEAAVLPQPGLARLPSGLRLAYAEWGPASSTALVLLHGLSDSWRAFEPLMACLPPSTRVVAVTLRGHGESDHPEHGYRLRDFASDVRDLLDVLGIGVALVAGHSLGASVAMRFSLDHGERTLGLALLGAFAEYRHNPAVLELQSAVAQLTDPVDGGFIRDFQLATLANPVAPERLDQIVQESRAVPARVWKAITESLLSSDGALPLSEIRVPTLLLWGEKDGFVPRSDQDRLLGEIAGAQLVVYPRAGHGFHWEDPRPTARELAAFMAACSGHSRAPDGRAGER